MKIFITRISLVLYFSIIGTVISYGQKYEAEDATFGGGPWIDNSDAGFSGTGYLRNFWELNSYVEFTVTGATAGTHELTMHYTSGVISSCHLYVNGVNISQVAIPSTNGWGNWRDYVAISVTLNAGNNTIKFQKDNDDTGYYYYDYLTVSEATSVAVTGVTISTETLNLTDISSLQLTATISPENASDKTVTWTSSNPAVATVSTIGLVEGKSAGNTTITATTTDGGKTATCEVTVTASNASIYESENATFGGGPWVDNSDAGYSGTGYLRNFWEVDSYVEFSITGATAGAQDVTMRYTSGVASSCHLYVNNVMIKQVTIPTTNGWGNWSDNAVNISLNAGNNTIKFQKDADDIGYYYFDYLKLSKVITNVASTNVKESDISLSQNPFSKGTLTITLPESATQLSIFDITGKAVYQKQVIKNEYLIDQFVFKSAGVYVVNVMTTTSSMNKKLIVTK